MQQYKRRVLDDNNDLVEELSLEHIMAHCLDFVNEKSHLEYVCEKLGARALSTTKYNAEMAGEGMEYSWAHSRGYNGGMSPKTISSDSYETLGSDSDWSH